MIKQHSNKFTRLQNVINIFLDDTRSDISTAWPKSTDSRRTAIQNKMAGFNKSRGMV